MTEETKTAAKEAAAEAATEEVKAEAQETETEAKPDKASKLKSENKALTAENEKLKKELAETSDKYLRMLAEYDNFRRRTQKEKEGIYADAYESALSAVLPVADNLERAALCTDGESLSDGVKMIIKQFSEALGKLGVEAYGARGDAFDPVVHNAVMQIEDEELGENTVAEVLQKGYKKGDRILRHAVVKVANV
ncbi:MAG TPA: nucleotide exchange factor GrpE [Clostridiales bacterium]|jgi:molecular chaperone GrpE|nr:nucleotide exchange factor GrpE [Candidatus Apopatosoma intestinale]